MSTKEQLNVIIRLDKNDDVVERTLKFYNVSSDKTAPVLIKDIPTHFGVLFTIN